MQLTLPSVDPNVNNSFTKRATPALTEGRRALILTRNTSTGCERMNKTLDIYKSWLRIILRGSYPDLRLQLSREATIDSWEGYVTPSG